MDSKPGKKRGRSYELAITKRRGKRDQNAGKKGPTQKRRGVPPPRTGIVRVDCVARSGGFKEKERTGEGSVRDYEE